MEVLIAFIKSLLKKFTNKSLMNKTENQEKKLKEIFIRLLLITVSGVIVYSNSFNASWHLDDYGAIVNNFRIKDLSATVKSLVFNPRGICDLTFAANYYFSRENVFGFHVANLAIHLISAYMVYFLISLTIILSEINDVDESSNFRNLPLLGSLIFLTHPIQTQAVTYIIQRYTSLATMFYLMSLVFFIKSRMNLLETNSKFFSKKYLPFYFSSLICAFLAMRTKEIGVTIPVIFLLYALIFFKFSKKDIRITFISLSPYFILLLIILILRIFLVSPDFSGLETAIDSSFKDPIARITHEQYAITSINVILTYIRLLFFPVNQNIYYTYQISDSIFSNYTYLSILSHIGILIFAAVMFRKSRLIAFGVFWFYITLSVESGIILIGDVIFEHRLYLPSVGFVIFFIGLLLLKIKWKNLFYAFTFVIIALLSIAAYNRNFVWYNDETLWNDSIAKSEKNSVAYYNLGNLYLHKNLYDEAIKKYLKVLEIDPKYREAYNNLGVALAKSKRYDEAIESFKAAIRLNKHYSPAIGNLGKTYREKGENSLLLDAALNLFESGEYYAKKRMFKEAIISYQELINLIPESTAAYGNLGMIFMLLNEKKFARENFKKILNYDPKNEAAKRFLKEIDKNEK